MNSNDSSPKLPIGIFIASDVVLLGIAAFVAWRAPHPLSTTSVLAIVGCAGLGAIALLVPIVLNHERQKNELLDQRQRALEGLATTLTGAAEQIGIATGGLHQVAELSHKNLKHAEQLPHKLQEKIAEFRAQLDNASDAEKEELEKELVALRSSESERLDAVSTRITKATAELARLEAATQQHLAAANEAVAKLGRGTADAIGKAQAAAEQALGQARAEAARALGDATGQAERALAEAAAKNLLPPETARAAALAEIEAKLNALGAALAEKLAGEIEARIAPVLTALQQATAQHAAALAAHPPVSAPTHALPENSASRPAEHEAVAAPVESSVAPAAPAKRPRKPRPVEPAPEAPVTPSVPDADVRGADAPAPAEPVASPAPASAPAIEPASASDRSVAADVAAPPSSGIDAAVPPFPEESVAPVVAESAAPETVASAPATESAPVEPASPAAPGPAEEPVPVTPDRFAEITPVVPHTAEPFESHIMMSPPPAPAASDAAPGPEMAAPVAAADAEAETISRSSVAAEPVIGEPIAAELPRKRPRKPARAAESAPDPEPALDLGLDDTPAQNGAHHESGLSSDGATRLIVTAYIGIGNRLFIRGEGPGLGWEKGVPLQFVSIGKWRWETNDAAAPIRFKLFKNDELECTALGAQALEPGRQHEMSATF